MILSNTSLIDFIDSEDVKKYYIENKIDIKCDLIFFMIYNSNKTLSEKYMDLQISQNSLNVALIKMMILQKEKY